MTGGHVVLRDGFRSPVGGRAVLRDDRDPPPAGVVEGNDRLLVTFSIRARTPVGEDDDGNPKFGWAEILRQIALRWEKRTETDAESGATYVRGELLIANPDDLTITESAMAVDVETEEAWRILSVHDHPESTRMTVERIHG